MLRLCIWSVEEMVFVASVFQPVPQQQAQSVVALLPARFLMLMAPWTCPWSVTSPPSSRACSRKMNATSWTMEATERYTSGKVLKMEAASSFVHSPSWSVHFAVYSDAPGFARFHQYLCNALFSSPWSPRKGSQPGGAFEGPRESAVLHRR